MFIQIQYLMWTDVVGYWGALQCADPAVDAHAHLSVCVHVCFPNLRPNHIIMYIISCPNVYITSSILHKLNLTKLNPDALVHTCIYLYSNGFI